ncbi:MAG: L-aspartate oxidase [Spirochaetes bacterium]|nr:L-aspartate oxidase [Spirochaetota bacterium]
MNSKIYESDFLVIGSGIAGLSFAIKASESGTVNIVTKKKDTDSNTNYAQGGISSVLADDDSFDNHIDDTIIAGNFLSKKSAVEVLVKNGPERIRELIEWGAEFSFKNGPDGKSFDLGREGGHSHNRIVHAMDLTGKIVEEALLKKAAEITSIKMFEDHTAVDLLTQHQLGEKKCGNDRNTTCYGAYVLENETKSVDIFKAAVTIIATGGAGNVYLHTTNPSIATGDGIAMAYRAGALVGDMEFMQFHPTAFYEEVQDGRALLISEAVRGEGALLYNSKGERFMEGVHDLKELAPRDIVARAIDKELKRLGDKHVFLDISFKDPDFLIKRFPFIYAMCLKKGVDFTKEPIPVVPAAHYLCGGIITDLNARSSIENLYVAGESACTGVHGANRLASNSLLEALVFSHQAFLHSSGYVKKNKGRTILPDFPKWDKEGTFDYEEWVLIKHDINEIKSLMWDYVGIVRSNLRLDRAYRRILFLEEEISDYYRRSTISSKLVQLRNMVTTAKLIICGAMTRKESRGLHFNTDYPDINDDMKKCAVQCSNAGIQMKNLDDIRF